jgi:hypothetical protein
MAVLKVIAVTVLYPIVIGCTDYGAWDLLGTLSNDVIDSSLLARYTFDNSISPELDYSGNGNDGLIVGATWENDPARGGVLDFESSSSSNRVELPAIANNQGGYTFTAWINIESPTFPRSALFYNNTDVASDIHTYVDNSGEVGLELLGATPSYATTIFNFDPGNFGSWYHIAVTYNRSAKTITFYINGQQDSTHNLTIAPAANIGPGWIGGWALDSRWFDGRMDDVRFYSRRLSDIEITAIYRATE